MSNNSNSTTNYVSECIKCRDIDERLEKKKAENRFWCRIWTTVAVAILSIFIIVNVRIGYTKHEISEAIKSGANPIEVKLAFSGNSNESQVITYLLSKNKK